jgi:hypothetical protein
MRRREHPLRLQPHQQVTMETRLALTSLPGGAESGVNLDLDQWRILSQIAVSQSLGEICEKIGMPPDNAIRTVTELVAIGLVEVLYAPATLAGAAAEDPTDMLKNPQTGADPLLSNGRGPSGPGRGILRAIMRRVRGI